MEVKLKGPENLISNGRTDKSRERISILRDRAIKLDAKYARFKEMLENLGEIELKRGKAEHDALLDHMAEGKRKDNSACHACNRKAIELIKRELGANSRWYCPLCNSLFIDNIFKQDKG